MKKAYIASLTIVLSFMGIVFLAAPAVYLATLGVQVGDSSVLNMIRSSGGFYLGFAAALAFIARKERGMNMAVAAAALAMAGLLVGRVTGVLADGAPHRSIFAAAAVELVFFIWGISILLKERTAKPRRA